MPNIKSAIKRARQNEKRRLRNKALRQYRIKQLEERQAAGYARHPVEPGEFDVWESEQVWGET